MEPHQIIPVTAALIYKGEKILITQRTANLSNGLKWEFPGGKIHYGEDPKDCLKREIREEIGIEISVGDIFEVVSHVYHSTEKSKHILLLCYQCKFVKGTPKKLEINVCIKLRGKPLIPCMDSNLVISKCYINSRGLELSSCLVRI